MKSDNGKSSLRYAWLLVLSFFVLCSCSPTKTQEIFKQPVGVALNTEISGTVFRINHLGDLPDAFGGHDILDRTVMKWWRKWFTKGRTSTPVEIDYAGIGGSLVGLLSESLKLESVDVLKKLARNWEPSADERNIDREVFLFHKFLLVQVCADLSSHQSFINGVVPAFYASLDQALVGDMQPPLYVTEFIRSRIGAHPDTLADLERLWVTRANQYEEPFAIDLEEYNENRPGHLPWKRLIVRFMSNFRESSGELHEILLEAEGAVPAIIAVAMTVAEYYKNVGEIIRS